MHGGRRIIVGPIVLTNVKVCQVLPDDGVVEGPRQGKRCQNTTEKRREFHYGAGFSSVFYERVSNAFTHS
jgi:hypothetical protein